MTTKRHWLTFSRPQDIPKTKRDEALKHAKHVISMADIGLEGNRDKINEAKKVIALFSIEEEESEKGKIQ